MEKFGERAFCVGGPCPESPACSDAAYRHITLTLVTIRPIIKPQIKVTLSQLLLYKMHKCRDKSVLKENIELAKNIIVFFVRLSCCVDSLCLKRRQMAVAHTHKLRPHTLRCSYFTATRSRQE